MRLRVLAVGCVVLSMVASAQAEVPVMSIRITAGKDTAYGRVVPILHALKRGGLSEIEFATSAENKIVVAIRVREDVKIATRDAIQERVKENSKEGRLGGIYMPKEKLDFIKTSLKNAGADTVLVESVPVFPGSLFRSSGLPRYVDNRRQSL